MFHSNLAFALTTTRNDFISNLNGSSISIIIHYQPESPREVARRSSDKERLFIARFLGRGSPITRVIREREGVKNRLN